MKLKRPLVVSDCVSNRIEPCGLQNFIDVVDFLKQSEKYPHGSIQFLAISSKSLTTSG